MARSTQFYGFWIEHNGKVVTMDGIKYELCCYTFEQRYPYKAEMISVSAVCVNKRSKFYRDRKEQLGDDWSIDVLDSDVTVQADVLSQLGVEPRT